MRSSYSASLSAVVRLAAQEGNEFSDLRFGVGSRVECRVGDDPVTGWASGSVVQLMYRDSSFPPGDYAPYQIELVNGTLIFAPVDNDRVIRKCD